MSTDYRERENPYSLFRLSLDTGMGILYLVIAVLIFMNRKFGTIELEPLLVYALSGLLVFYGGFRIYRAIEGFKMYKQLKK